MYTTFNIVICSEFRNKIRTCTYKNKFYERKNFFLNIYNYILVLYPQSENSLHYSLPRSFHL